MPAIDVDGDADDYDDDVNNVITINTILIPCDHLHLHLYTIQIISLTVYIRFVILCNSDILSRNFTSKYKVDKIGTSSFNFNAIE